LSGNPEWIICHSYARLGLGLGLGLWTWTIEAIGVNV